jgi:DNA recombination protein RmuC
MAQIIIGLAIGAGASIIIFFLCRRLLEKHTRGSFDDLSRKTMTELIPSFLDLAKKELGSVRQEISNDVSKEKSIIKESLEKLEQGIKEKQEELKKLELDRNRQFGTISESIKSHQEITEKLKEKTENLSKILASNKLRGAWGERIAEDVLQYAGLRKGVHYIKQTAGLGGTVPDFTLILPNKRKINIDAKFPFDNLRAYQEAEDADLKKQYLAKFTHDIKQKIREVTTRDYINEQENTLDYVILFVPSDIVYGFINERTSGVVDNAFAKKVLITSPTSLYATLRIIMESYRHFMYEKNIREVLRIVSGFIENFHKFQDEFAGFDDAITKLRKTYNQIAETRYKKMGVQIRRIEKLEEAKTIAADSLTSLDQEH